MTATWEMILSIADGLQDFVPQTAAKLRFIASEVRYLETIVNDRDGVSVVRLK